MQWEKETLHVGEAVLHLQAYIDGITSVPDCKLIAVLHDVECLIFIPVDVVVSLNGYSVLKNRNRERG